MGSPSRKGSCKHLEGTPEWEENMDSIVQTACLPTKSPLRRTEPLTNASDLGFREDSWMGLLLTSVDPGIKEVANVCNQSLMKLVTPEDDEPDEPRPVVQKQADPNPDDSLAKQEGTGSGE